MCYCGEESVLLRRGECDPEEILRRGECATKGKTMSY